MARIGATSANGPVTGSDNFFIKQQLDAEGVITNTSGNLYLSSSIVSISGNVYCNGLPVLSGVLDLSASIVYVGDTRYVLTSSYGPFTASINDFTSSINSFTASLNLASSSFANNFDNLNLASSSFAITLGSLNLASSSFVTSISNLNSFSASFSSSVMTVGDNRYILTASLVEQRISSSLVVSGNLTILSGNYFQFANSTILSASRDGYLSILKNDGITGVVFGVSGVNVTLYHPSLSTYGNLNAGTLFSYGTILSTGDLIARSLLKNDQGHLILSSSAGSTVTISGTLKTTFSLNVGGEATVNGGGLYAQNYGTYLKHLYITSLDSAGIDCTWQHLILSSSAGSVVALSSNLYFPSDAPISGAHIVAQNSDLILSSSTTSQVYVSGALRTKSFYTGGSYFNGTTWYFGNAVQFNSYTIVKDGSSFGLGNYAQDSRLYPNSANQQLIFALNSTFHGRQLVIADVDVFTQDFGHPPQDHPTLYLHSVLGPSVDNTQWMSLQCNGSASMITSNCGALILSSSAGSVIYVSGNLGIPTNQYINFGNRTFLSSSNKSGELVFGSLEDLTLRVSFSMSSVAIVDLKQPGTTSMASFQAGNIYARAGTLWGAYGLMLGPTWGQQAMLTSPSKGRIKLCRDYNEKTGSMLDVDQEGIVHITSYWGDMTGSLDAGRVINSSGTLIFSSSQSMVTVSGNLKVNESLILPASSSVMGIQVGHTGSSTYPWRDIIGDVSPKPLAPNAPSIAVFRGGTYSAYFYSAGDLANMVFHVPHDYAMGTDMFLHLHWAHNGTSITGSLVSTLGVSYAKGHNQSNFDVEVAPVITVYTPDIATVPQYRHRIDEVQISAVSPSATQLSSSIIEPDGLILVNLTTTTIPTIAGGSTNEPAIFTCDLHYQSTGIGTKNKVPNFYA
jgi:hypothetical protein